MVKKQRRQICCFIQEVQEHLVGGQVLVGRSKVWRRLPLCTVDPYHEGVSLLIDCSANVDARPSHLVQFAKIGSIYMENVVGIKIQKLPL